MLRTILTITASARSTRKKNVAAKITNMNTITVETVVSFRVGQVTLAVSRLTCSINSPGFTFAIFNSVRRPLELRNTHRSFCPDQATYRYPGRSGGTRTPNPRFWRPVLCQLSYTPRIYPFTRRWRRRRRHRRCARPRGSRNASPRPSQSARSAPRPSRYCRPASPSRSPPAVRPGP